MTDTENPDIRYSLRDVEVSDRDQDYFDSIAQHDDINVVHVPKVNVPRYANGGIDKAQIFTTVRNNPLVDTINGHYVTFCDDIDVYVELNADGIKHGFGPYASQNKKVSPTPTAERNARAAMLLPELLKNAVEVNRSRKYSGNGMDYGHVLMAVYAETDSTGKCEYYAVRIVVEHNSAARRYNLIDYGVVGQLHAVNAKKMQPSQGSGSTVNGTTASASSVASKYSVADLITDVKTEFGDTFSAGAYQKAGLTRKNTDFSQNLMYALRDGTPETTVREFIAEAGDAVAATAEERNALKIYRKRLDDYAQEVKNTDAAEQAWKAAKAKYGARSEQAEKEKRVLNARRAKQKAAYNALIAAEETQHVAKVLDFTRQFVTEALNGTPDEIAQRQREAEALLSELESQYEELKAAGRTQMATEQRRNVELQRQYAALFESRVAKGIAKRKAEFREREEKARAYRKARETLTKQRNRIGRKVKRLNRLRTRETDREHVPQEMRKLADAVMTTVTESSLAKLAFGKMQTAALARTYQLLAESESDAAYYWDENIETEMQNLADLAEEYTALREKTWDVPSVFSLEGVELESSILEGVEDIVDHVVNLIDSENRAFLEDRAETLAEFATKTGAALLEKGDHKELKGRLGTLQTILEENVAGNSTPIYFFEHLQNPRLLAVYNGLRDGQRSYAKIVKEAQEFVQETKEKYHYGKWVDDAPLVMKTAQGHEIELTREEAAALYATDKREKSMKLMKTEHLSKGGFQYGNASAKGKGKYKAPNEANRLNGADMAKINAWLTEEQKAYADALVGYLSTEMAAYGNEASMEMYGYKKFTEGYYFPFKTSGDQRQLRGNEGAAGENGKTGRVKNSGFTHKVLRGAKNTLVIGDITRMVTDHIHGMAYYAAMTRPIDNMNRLLNYEVATGEDTTGTIRTLIRTKYGKASQDYMLQLLKDLNGAAESDNRQTTGMNKLIGTFKRSAVVASLSVVLQQPTAACRAMAYIPAKYFAQNPFYRPSKGTWDEMMKYSGTAVIKDMGKFDMGMSQTAGEYIADENLAFFRDYQRLKAEGKLGKRAMDWWTAAPGLADQWTWGLMWKANKAMQADLHPEMDKNSEEFLNLCGKTFDDLMDHTQVYDSVLTRSSLMRSTNALHKMATAFKAEPTLSLNMLYDALTNEAYKGKKGARAGRIVAVMASQVLAGAMAALVQAWNDDDDERNWLEKYVDKTTGNIMDNLNPLNMIPYVSDVMSLVQGYEVERQDMSVVSDVINYTTSFFKKVWDEDTSPEWKDYENFIGTLCDMVGLPAQNISREMRRTWNAITNTDWGTPDAFNVGQVVLENMPGYDSAKTTYYERIVAAELRGDTELAAEYQEYMLTSKMVSETALKTGMKKAYGEQYKEGDVEKADAIQWLLDHGMEDSQTDAFTTVDKWEEGSEKHSVYNTVREAVEAKSITQAKAAIKELTDNGWGQDDVAAQTRKAVRELYASGKLTQADVKTMYNSLSLHPSDFDKDDENDWYWLYKELDYAKANGGSSEGYSRYGDFETACRTGTNLQSVVREYLSHGVSKSTLSSRVTEYFKQEYIDLYNAGKRTELANMQVRILTAYQALGYDRDKKLKDIQKWLE